MDIRSFDLKEDMRAVERIWYECGWIDSPEQAGYLKDFFGVGSALVGCLNGTPECAVHTVPGTIQYLDETLKLCAVTAVTTSRIARKQGFARVMTARQLAEAAEAGAEVAALGMFEQGFYDQLGFGTGSYEHTIYFDPASLLVDAPFQVPSRLHKDDWPQVHQAMSSRQKHHGACCLTPPELMKAELAWVENGFGLGYYEGETLTHGFWGDAKEEHGPYDIAFLFYRSVDELLELLALLKSLGDQISSVGMHEPAHIQLQTLLKQPFRNRRNTRSSKQENVHRASAWWQVRILDVAACVAKRSWPGAAIEFNLTLEDPAAKFLPEDGWQGAGGEYHVHVGVNSKAAPGSESGLPAVKASINAFSRLIFGVASATQLQAGDDFDAPEPLRQALDEAFCLPPMSTSWDF